MSRAAELGQAVRIPVSAQENPFRTERLDGLGFRAAATGAPADLGDLLERFEALGRRAAVIGPEGSGKTTLLDALDRQLTGRGFEVRRLRAAPGGGALWSAAGPARRDGAGPRTLLFVDGIDRLPAAARRRVRRAARGAAGLLVTAHRRLRLPTLIECATTPALLAALVEELAGGSAARWPVPAAAALHARHRGNLRTALLELYDLCAGR